MSVLAVGCGKGSPGATFVAINLAFALCGEDRSVLLLDLDPHGGDMASYLGLDPRRGLFPLMHLEGKAPSSDTLRREAELRGGVLCLAGYPRAEDADAEMIDAVLTASSEATPLVVADLGRITPTTARLFANADHVLIAVRPDLVGVFAARRAVETLSRANPTGQIAAVVTGWEWRRAADLAESVEALDTKVVGSIPMDRHEARRALLTQAHLSHGPASKAFTSLAHEVKDMVTTPLVREAALL